MKNIMKADISSLTITPSLQKGFVYCAHNILNEKVYIGYTTTTLKNRIKAHYYCSRSQNKSNNYFKNALSKYKKEDFKWYVLYESKELAKLIEQEKYFVQLLESNNRKYGYNLTTGGEIPNFNEEVCKKISNKAKQRNLNGKNNPFFGKHHSEEQRTLWSETRKGKVNNPDFKNHSQETKNILSQKAIDKWKALNDEEKQLFRDKHSKSIICLNNGMKFKSLIEASITLNINKASISHQLTNRAKTAGGFQFKYL
jgi:group I intron endonuclease